MMVMHKPAAFVSKQVDSDHGQSRVEKPLIVERKGDKIIWRLQADVARQEGGIMVLMQPTLELFTDDQEIIVIRGNKAWFEPLRQNIEFKGMVRAGFREWELHAEHLQYNSMQDAVTVPGRFKVLSSDTRVHGQDLRADRKTQRISIAQHVRVWDAGKRGIGRDF